MTPLRSLARFVAPEVVAGPVARCEVCGGPLGERHRHVVELGERGVQCACPPCAMLFERRDAARRFRTIPDRVRRDPSFSLAPERLAELGIPVALAICYRDSMRERGIVCYPGPAGITEAELEDAAWDTICAATPLAADLADDVEALLVRGGRGVRALACYLVPISKAYELVGRLRAVWTGFAGGEAADAELAAFFADLDRKGERA